ncbi:hypothetical protein ACF06V_05455 [Streptomyces bobili]|uniref:hypothetical protein n=1 Tax=Streptomyces bobili TaxID=67280 RepID=UPI0036FDC6BA
MATNHPQGVAQCEARLARHQGLGREIRARSHARQRLDRTLEEVRRPQPSLLHGVEHAPQHLQGRDHRPIERSPVPHGVHDHVGRGRTEQYDELRMPHSE